MQSVHYLRVPGPESAPVVTAEHWRPIIHRCVIHERETLLASINAILKGSVLEQDPVGPASVGDDLRSSGTGTLQRTRQDTRLNTDAYDAFKQWVDANRSRFVVLAQNAQREKKQEWPVPIEGNHCRLSYRIVHPTDAEIPAGEFIQALRHANNSVRTKVWTGWSMFYVFDKPEITPRVRPQTIGGEDTDVYECNHLGHHAHHATTLPDFWLATRHGWATIMRPYREDRLPTATVGSHQMQAGDWLSGFLLVRELTELAAHASAMLDYFPQALSVEFDCYWCGLNGRTLYDQFSDSTGGISETSSRSARTSVTAAALPNEWPSVISSLANKIMILFGPQTISPQWVQAASPRFRMDWIPQPISTIGKIS